MGGNYTKSIYNQLMKVMETLDSMEAAYKKDRKEITTLTAEVKILRQENARLWEEVSSLRQKTSAQEDEIDRPEKENCLLRNDNERMKRILGNNSSNSSLLQYICPLISGSQPWARDIMLPKLIE